MMTNDDKKSPKNADHFYCDKCDFICSKLSDWKRHLLRLKHQNDDKMMTNDDKKTPKNATPLKYFCGCGKQYAHRQGLNVHKKKCKTENENKNNELLSYLIKENSDLKAMVLDVCKKIQPSVNNTAINCNNKTFNLNFFLNEKCKDALNISDFVSSIKPTLEELEYTGRQGYVAGISNIIIKKLNSLEEYIRPIHCCDSKREILYIKENDEWTKESEEKPILTKAIKLVANENIKNIKEWRDAHPHCTDSDSQKNNLYLKIVSNSMCGLDKEETEKNTNKIISNVIKEVTIQKSVI
jgi:hypothetical protein